MIDKINLYDSNANTIANSDSKEFDKIDYDMLTLSNDTNIEINNLREIRQDIDDYIERLSKLKKRLSEVVEEYDDNHRIYS